MLAGLPILAVAGPRGPSVGRSAAGGPLDPRRKDGTLGDNDKDQVQPEKSERNKASEEDKTEGSGQKGASD